MLKFKTLSSLIVSAVASLVFVVSADADAEPVSGVTLEQQIEAAKILSEGYKVRVKVAPPEVQVSTFENLRADNPDNDCKIDAVLIAKKVLELSGEKIARVKVRFYNRAALNRFREVSITIGDVLSYGSNQIPTERLLASLEVLVKTEANAETRKSIPGKSSPSSPGPAKEAPATQAHSAGAVENIKFKSPAWHVSFYHPRSWNVAPEPFPDTVVVVSGVTNKGQACEIKLTHSPVGPGIRLEDVAGGIIDGLQKTPALRYRKTYETHGSFGSGSAFSGLRITGSMYSGATPVIAQQMFFVQGGEIMCFWCACPGWSESDARSFFDQFLRSVASE